MNNRRDITRYALDDHRNKLNATGRKQLDLILQVISVCPSVPQIAISQLNADALKLRFGDRIKGVELIRAD